MSLRGAVSFAAVFVIPSGPSGAAETQRAVAVMHATSTAGPGLNDALWRIRAAVDAHPKLVSVDVAERLAETTTDALEEARLAMDDGRAAFDELQIDRALRSLEVAARLYETAWRASGSKRSASPEPEAVEEPSDRRAAPAGDALRDLTVEALSLLASTRAAANDDWGASVTFTRLLEVDPSFKLSGDDIAPSVRKLFKAARAGTTRKDKFALRLDAAPTPGAIFIDGRYVGITPRLVADLPSPVARVRIAADGFAPWDRVVTLRKGSGVSVEAVLDAQPKAALWDGIMERMPQQADRQTLTTALKDVRALLFAEQAIVVQAEGEAVVVDLYDLQAGRKVRSVRAAIDDSGLLPGVAEELVDALYKNVDPLAPGLTELAAEDPMSLDTDSGVSLLDEWWFWTAVGVATVTAIAIPVAVASGDDESIIARHDGQGAAILRF